MVGTTLDELRELSARSRRTQARGFLALVAALGALPVLAVVHAGAPAWFGGVAGVAILLGGGCLVGYAHAAGQERGAYRRVFRRLRGAPPPMEGPKGPL